MTTRNGKLKPPRQPLTDEELKRLPPSELVRLKLTKDEIARLRIINDERVKEISINRARVVAEGEPIRADLQKVGCDVETVWDLVNSSEPYPETIPVLLWHLLLPYSDRIREGIARALAVRDPQVQNAWPLLVEQYKRAPQGWGVKWPGDSEECRLGAKDGLAIALAVSVPEERLPELIELAKDRAHGESRVLLLAPLRKSKSYLAKEAIAELAQDPDLAKEISSWR